MASAAERFLPKISGAEIELACIGWRPLTVDGRPVLEASAAIADVSMAIMHSGITLAPIAGQLVAQQTIGSESVERLNHYRPTGLSKLSSVTSSPATTGRTGR